MRGPRHGGRETATEAPPAKHWSLVSTDGPCPTARSGHSAVVAKDSLYIFGGCGLPAKTRSAECEGGANGRLADSAEPICLGDLHVYDLLRQRWSDVVCPRGSSEEARPAERTCAAMCASAEEDRLFLSGGAGDDPYDLRGDLLEYDVRRRSWRVLYEGNAAAGVASVDAASSDISAGRRIGHAMVHDAARDRLVVFGGSAGLEYFDDTLAFDLASCTWTTLSTTGDRPSPRYKHQAFVDANLLYVIGGGSYEPEGPDLDVYRLHLSGPRALEWERVRPTGNPPRCRAAHGLAWDPVGRAAHVWGGFTSGMELDCTFFTLRLPPLSPPATAVDAAAQLSVAAVAAPPVCSPVDSAFNSVPRVTVDAAPDASAASLAAAAAAIGGIRDLAGFATAGSNPNHAHQAAAAAAAAAVARNKPSSNSGGDGGNGTSPVRAGHAEEEGEENGLGASRTESPGQHHQQQHQQQRPRQQEQGTLSLQGERGTGTRGGYGREGWRRRGQRLWRQGSGESVHESRTSANRRPRVNGRRRSWSQGWTTGRLQGLWGGGGGANANAPPPAPAPPAPTPPPDVLPASATATRGAEMAGVSTQRREMPTAHSPIDRGLPRHPAEAEAGDGLSWVSLNSGADGGASGSGRGSETMPPSPAGRSFHCAFFHGGACYVTGGSDGDQKFGDLWRFPARETPPPLATLAARTLASMGASAAARGKNGAGGGSDGTASQSDLLAGLPEELRVALANLNPQAEAVL